MVRILVVEDEPHMREALTEVLVEEGYAVDAASNGADAVLLAEHHPYDLIVTDVRMEGMDGLTTLEHVQRAQPEIRSLVVTGYSSEEDSIRGLKLGTGDWLRKPFPLDHFLRRVNEQVGRHRKERERVEHEHRLRTTGLWALMRVAELSQPEVARAARLAGQLARRTGTDPLDAASLALEQGLSVPGTRPLSALSQPWSESIPLVQRVVALALGTTPEPDPMLAELLEDCDPELELDLEAPSAQPGSLLTLGLALEDRDAPAAARAYQLLLGSGSREEAQACLRLAALARRQGLSPREWAEKAVALAATLPGAEAPALLEAGLLLEEQGLLQRAASAYARAGQAGGEALARLAAGDTGALEVLLWPEHSDQLMAQHAWALPRLLELWGKGGNVRLAVARLLREGPPPVETLSDAARLALVEALSAASSAPAELVERLTRDALPAVSQAARTLQAKPRPAMLRVLALGPFEAYRGDELVNWKNPRARPSQLKFLLAYVLAHPGVHREKLADELYPEDPVSGRRKLSLALTLLQQALGEQYTTRNQETVSLTGELWHDLTELEMACREADRLEAAGALEEAASWRQKAGRLYRGGYLEECGLDWVLPIRARAERLAVAALNSLVGHFNRTGRPAQAHEWAQRLLEIDDCCQDAYAGGMQASLALGRYEEAVRAYETCRRVLKKELAMEPSLEVFELYQRARLSL